jgi:hypothetical protein
MAKVPYENATSGMKARDELTTTLRRFGCENVGFMDDFADATVLLAFSHRGRQVQLKASAKGWAAMWLRENPYSNHRKASRQQWEARALQQGLIAVNSILRDWVKGQVTAVETGILSFEAVFVAHMLTSDGRSVLERIQSEKLLPPPTEGK